MDNYKYISIIAIQILSAGIVWGILVQNVKDLIRRTGWIEKDCERKEKRLSAVENRVGILEALDKDRHGRHEGE